MKVVTGSASRSARGALGLAVMAVALIFASVASAATYTVGAPSDTAPNTPCATFPSNCSLRQLVEYENGAGTNDTIIVPAGSYTVDSALVINSSLSIQGAGARTTSVQAGGSDRVFFVQPLNANSVPTVTMSGLMIAQGIATASNGSFGGD